MPTRRPTSLPQGSLDRFEDMALRFLARQARSGAQLRAFLNRRGAPRQSIEAIVDRFVQQGYLDDAVYALERARAKLNRQPMGRAGLEADLLGKGISQTTVEHTLDDIFSEHSEEELARRLLGKPSESRKTKSRAQAAGLLRRYGFAEDTIEKLVNEGFGD